MLVVDEERKRRQDAGEALERTRDITRQGWTTETRAAGAVADRRTSVANADRQGGRWLSATEFIRKLRGINPDLVLEPHPHRDLKVHRDKACIYLLLPSGIKEFIIVCENDRMPEWSIMDTITVRKEDHGGVMKDVKIPGHEVKRGWRTVLIRLIHKGLVSLERVETVFGVGNRETWRVLTGKGQGQLLI